MGQIVCRAAFAKLKAVLSKTPVLQNYDITKEIVTHSCSETVRNLVDNQTASRALTTTEHAYAEIEREQLVVCYARKRSHT